MNATHPCPPDTALPVLVVGAGPAGLATAAELSRRQVPYRLLERGESLGHSWTQLYDSLVLHTGRHMSALPGRRFQRGTPLFPSRDHLVEYLRDYAAAFSLRVEAGMDVVSLRRSAVGWCATLKDGSTIDTGAVVMATGIMANPRMPVIPRREDFQGRVLHSVEYRRPAPFAGRRVLVVGVGNSGGEIASELGNAGVDVTVVARSGAHVVPLAIGGVPIQYLARAVRVLPRTAQEFVVRQVQRVSERRRGPPVLPRPAHSSLDAIPLIGFHLVDAIREGRVKVKLGALQSFTADGVTFSDQTLESFDCVILATGFAPALSPLGKQVTTDDRGFALRSDRVTSRDQPGLYFVGHNYDATGGLANIRRDAPLVAERIAQCRVVAIRMRSDRDAAIKAAAQNR
ncbi:MAG: NAD(P)/FAD-dependent oxidoreductase [Gemmatimonadaceae bacterium]